MAYLVAVTADGGLPLFVRARDGSDSLPFSVIASLNGVHMYAEDRGATLKSTTAGGKRVVWRTFHDSLTLIMIDVDETTGTEHHMFNLLDLCFSALVLYLGIGKLSDIRNTDRLKKEMKCAYALLDGLCNFHQSLALNGHVTGLSDVIVGPNTTILQTYLDGFADRLDTNYGCVLIGGKVCAATEKWWQLSCKEAVLLSCLVNSHQFESTVDIPVFLPVASPKLSHRLLVFRFKEDVFICALCGPEHDLQQVENEIIPQYWNPASDCLDFILQDKDRGLPDTVQLDAGILAFIYLCFDLNRSLSSFQIDSKTDPRLPLERRQRVLLQYYLTTQRELISKEGVTGNFALVHPVCESYLCADDYKSYCLLAGKRQLFLLYSHTVPTFALRDVAHQTIQILDKAVA
ncbi:protein fuzzy homolog [Corticium candelabrum]|uniref:protein fuzzy homolog n=1 Tax=Corticium candelabrum TaxID=121492 RepID=UPI002E264DE3|nr:protein fuzzy homolog [Corticium candelabrum]